MALWTLLVIGDPGAGGLAEDFLAFLIALPELSDASPDPLGLEINFLAFFNAPSEFLGD